MSEPHKPGIQQSAFERWEVVEPVSAEESNEARAARLLIETTRIREQARAEGIQQGIEDVANLTESLGCHVLLASIPISGGREQNSS